MDSWQRKDKDKDQVDMLCCPTAHNTLHTNTRLTPEPKKTHVLISARLGLGLKILWYRCHVRSNENLDCGGVINYEFDFN